MNMLIICPDLPFPSYRNGRTSTVYALIDEWRKYHRICVIVNEVCDKDGVDYYENMGITVVENPAVRQSYFDKLGNEIIFKPRNLWSYGRSLPNDLNYSSYELIVVVGFESVLHFSSIISSEYRGKLVFFELDCLSLLYKRFFLASTNFLKKFYYFTQFKTIEKVEKYFYSIVDRIFFVSSADRDYCVSRFGDVESNKFDCINNGVLPSDKTWRLRKSSNALKLCFSGNFDYLPNRMAAEFILNEIIPKLTKKCVPFVFHLVGTNPGADLLKMTQSWGDKVVVTGFVPDIDAYLSDMDIYVSPLFLGTGMKNKILQAMTLGIPLVCSNISIDGITEMQDEYGCLVCNSMNGDEWVSKTLNLANDTNLCQLFSSRSMQIINASYRWDNIATSFLDKAVCDINSTNVNGIQS